MDDAIWLAEIFESHRSHLRAVAYRMLGSVSEADDALQEAWLRFSRANTSDVENLGGWLTTVVARVCLDMLRSRRSRREAPLSDSVPEVTVGHRGTDPEQEAVLAESIGTTLLVVLEHALHHRSGSPSCSTTCSPCHSTRSRRSWNGHPPPPGSSQPRPPTGARGRRHNRRRSRPTKTRWSAPSSPPHATATSTSCSPCSIPTSCCEPTPLQS